MFDIVPPRMNMEDEYVGRVQTVLPVAPRRRPVLHPVQPTTPLLARKPLRHASSHDFLSEKARYYRRKSPDSALAAGDVPAMTLPPFHPFAQRSSPPLSPVGSPEPPRRVVSMSMSTARPTASGQSVPPVPPIPTDLIRPTDKVLQISSSVPGETRRPRRGTLGTRCISMSQNRFASAC